MLKMYIKGCMHSEIGILTRKLSAVANIGSCSNFAHTTATAVLSAMH